MEKHISILGVFHLVYGLLVLESLSPARSPARLRAPVPAAPREVSWARSSAREIRSIVRARTMSDSARAASFSASTHDQRTTHARSRGVFEGLGAQQVRRE